MRDDDYSARWWASYLHQVDSDENGKWRQHRWQSALKFHCMSSPNSPLDNLICSRHEEAQQVLTRLGVVVFPRDSAAPVPHYSYQFLTLKRQERGLNGSVHRGHGARSEVVVVVGRGGGGRESQARPSPCAGPGTRGSVKNIHSVHGSQHWMRTGGGGGGGGLQCTCVRTRGMVVFSQSRQPRPR